MVCQEGLLICFHFGFQFGPICLTKNHGLSGFLFLKGRLKKCLSRDEIMITKAGRAFDIGDQGWIGCQKKGLECYLCVLAL